MTILNCYIPGTVKCIHHDMNGKWGKKTLTNPMHLNAKKTVKKRFGIRDGSTGQLV